MHITEIELENIKSHVSSKYNFEPGTIAITGENGAGKTTIIEAVAWTLFDLLDYKKDDFVRRGSKKGIARVTFQSGLDEREYTVYRDTGNGYYVFDPQLNLRIAEKKEEVCRFLWQHLGVETGTDLESLFRRAIGVPQGTFTAIFLESAAERKKAFDRLLKVEEYRRGADELLKTVRYVEQTAAAVRERIARGEGEIALTDAYRREYAEVAAQVRTMTAELADLEAQLSQKQADVAALDTRESVLRDLKNAFDSLAGEHGRCELISEQCKVNLDQSSVAATAVERVRQDSETYLSAAGRISELERERLVRDGLLSEASKIDAAIGVVKNDRLRAGESLDKALAAHARAFELKAACAEEERITKELESLRDERAKLRTIDAQVASLDKKMERLRESYRANQAAISEANVKYEAAAGVERWQQRDTEIVQTLARLQANLERDERFQADISNGLCPLLSQKCLNLKEGETLESFVSSQFTEIKSQISELEVEHATVHKLLESSREAVKSVAALDALRKREEEIGEEGKRLRDERDALVASGRDRERVEMLVLTAESDLRSLGNPTAAVAMLKREAEREVEIRSMITTIESNLERLESDRRITAEKLENYKDLNAELAKNAELRDATAEAHRIFIVNEPLAKLLGERRQAFEQAEAKLAATAKKLTAAKSAFETADREYDGENHRAQRARLVELQTSRAETGACLQTLKQREDGLARELKRLAEIRASMLDDLKEKSRLEKVAEVTDFIRATLKDAAPLVAKNYVHHVSIEANQLFREISGNAERSLKWADDYGIVLEENGFERAFASLSGGEQMSAALAVRLALLKQLTDIRIAFFDEPTTNMDAERRENLATEIAKIRHFDQLFVISHDDTFEGHMEHEIRIG